MNFCCYSLNCFSLVSFTKFWYFLSKICIWNFHIQMLHKKYQNFCRGHLSWVKRIFHSKQSPGSAPLYIILIDVPKRHCVAFCHPTIPKLFIKSLYMWPIEKTPLKTLMPFFQIFWAIFLWDYESSISRYPYCVILRTTHCRSATQQQEKLTYDDNCVVLWAISSCNNVAVPYFTFWSPK